MYENGKKNGKWEFFLKLDKNERQLGEGVYDENQLKNGQWIDLYENFKIHSQVRYKGKYQKSKKQDNRHCQRLKQQLVMEIMMEMERRLVNGLNYMINLKRKYEEGIKNRVWKRLKRISGKGNFISDDENEIKQNK
ncbi:unnamed protein product [Paramecium pentaurelia]|uniref:Uncharacterized protein n=1 Tax=Paramecium pentaurelia TaxID=43138 RepID=A0A8S1U3C9_9CILI|nr:unnamed protein product [Paramecium pentaurelia]CAD8159145.1 unnamed protein product [Paramecium pentaurelia]